MQSAQDKYGPGRKTSSAFMGSLSEVKNDQWKNVVTIDEAMFYLGGSNDRRRVYYVRQPHMNRDNIKYVKRDTFAPDFMVWAGVSSRGKTRLRIIDRGVKVDSRYYV